MVSSSSLQAVKQIQSAKYKVQSEHHIRQVKKQASEGPLSSHLHFAIYILQ